MRLAALSWPKPSGVLIQAKFVYFPNIKQILQKINEASLNRIIVRLLFGHFDWYESAF